MPGKKNEILKISILKTARAFDIFVVSGAHGGQHWALKKAPRAVRIAARALVTAIRKARA